MQIIKSVLTPEEQQIFGYFCYHCGNNNASEELFPIEFANKLIGANLACEVTDTAKLLKHLVLCQDLVQVKMRFSSS